MNDDVDFDHEGLSAARWLRLFHTITEVLNDAEEPHRSQLALFLEIELGLRSVLDIARSQEEPLPAAELLGQLEEFADGHTECLSLVVPRIERALATQPPVWLKYILETGRACFDPTELAACAAIAKDNAVPGAPEHLAVNAIMEWAVETVLGQLPIPVVRSARFAENPTVILDVIREVGKVELNWRSLGLTPVIDKTFALRWDEAERWTAFVRLMSAVNGKISRDRILRLRSDGLWRIVHQ
jgi:hypothetical protein